jgi:outer membrane lipoprotein-sorting protein
MIPRLRTAQGRWLAAIAATAWLAGAPSSGHAQDPVEIMDRIDRLLRGESSHGLVTMEITTEHWSRSLEMEVWSLGTEHSLVRVTEPPREAGTATLKAGQEVWNYLPRVDRTIKVPPSLMMGSWMGSHFTNDDLVKESRIIDDYDIEITFDGLRDEILTWDFRLTPKPEAPVVWGHIEYEVRQDDLMPTTVRYYDEDGDLERTMVFSDYTTMGGRLVPASMVVRPADEPEEYTALIYHDLAFDIDIDEGFFSLRNLRTR